MYINKDSFLRLGAPFTLIAMALIAISCGLIPDNTPSRSNKPKSQTSGPLDKICDVIQTKTSSGPLRSLTELPNRFLQSHNEIRKLYGLPDLVWDDKIAAYAQKWANHLRDTRKCESQHRYIAGIKEGKEYGENLAWNWQTGPVAKDGFNASPEFAVYEWSKECEDYDYDSNSCAQGKQCGHFTQNVWKDTRKVGCGVATCDGVKKPKGVGHSEIWVCNYDPGGNVSVHDLNTGKITKLKPF